MKRFIYSILLVVSTLESISLKEFDQQWQVDLKNKDNIEKDTWVTLYSWLRKGDKQIINEKFKSDYTYHKLAVALHYHVLYVPFDESVRPRLSTYILNQEELQWWATMKQWYEAYSLNVIVPSPQPKIPKLIHQIWLGPAPFPEEFEQARQSIIKLHPGWKYKLWTDADIKTFGLKNKKLFDAATNYGEKSDILRYEILERYGGVYLDVDMQCVQSLEILHHCYELYVGIAHYEIRGLAIGIIGAVPEHPILKLVTSSLQDIGSKTDLNDIMIRSGPAHFTQCYMQLFQQFPGTVIAFPTSYFYPIPARERFNQIAANAHFIRPETFTIHYWGCTWQRPEATVKENA